MLANVAYCAAYVVDVFVRMSGFREQWRAYRWMLFFIGMSFAAGTVVTMAATPDPASPLISWTGAARAPRAPVLFWYSLQKVEYGEDPGC